MNSRVARIDTGMSVSLIASAVIHLAVFLLLVWHNRMFPMKITIQETYYVDVVNLPVAEPQFGNTASSPVESSPAPIQNMNMPAPAGNMPKITQKPARSPVFSEAAVSEAAFADRMATLEGKAETRRHEERIKKLSSTNSKGEAKTGIPVAEGTEAGSRYIDYLKSQLEDALKLTSSYTTKKPEVAARLSISADGRLLRVKIERSSGDPTFELAVRRAIDLASGKFSPPPDNTAFESGFIFKPKGISNGSPR